MNFSITEFLELEPTDYLEYWAVNRLPHPGCPVSFKLLIEGVHLVHKTVAASRREQAFKELAGVVSYSGSECFSGVDFCALYWPLQQKKIFVPLDRDQHPFQAGTVLSDLNQRMKGTQP